MGWGEGEEEGLGAEEEGYACSEELAWEGVEGGLGGGGGVPVEGVGAGGEAGGGGGALAGPDWGCVFIGLVGEGGGAGGGSGGGW